MSRARSLVLCLLSLFTVGAITAASASAVAPEWWVAGKVIAAEEKVAEQIKTAKATTIAGTAFTVECQSVKAAGGVIGPKNTNTLKAFVFEGCSIVGNTSCEIPTFETRPLAFPLEDLKGEKEKIKLSFKPETGNTLAVITINSKKGQTCVVAGKDELKTGESGMDCEYPEVEKERTEHVLQFNKGSGSKIMIGSQEVTLTTEMFARLSSGKEWSARV